MTRITYEQTRADWQYLWDIGPAHDMTGGYVDQEDLAKLLRSPTKATANACMQDQIAYWFQIGPVIGTDENGRTDNIDWHDIMIRDIAERHGHLPDHLQLEDGDYE